MSELISYERVRLEQPKLLKLMPWVKRWYKTVAWEAYRNGDLVDKGEAYTFEEGRKEAGEALDKSWIK